MRLLQGKKEKHLRAIIFDKMDRLIKTLLVRALFLLIMIATVVRASDIAAQENMITQSSYSGKLGYGVSPEGHPYDFSKFGEFLQEVADSCYGGVVYANSAWRDSFGTSGQIPNLQKIISLLQPTPYNYVDMLNFGWRSGDSILLRVPGDTTNNWSNATAKSLFLQMLINVADSLQPAYLFIGNEISAYWVIDSFDYLNWVDFYNEAYDSIKVHAPNIKVGTVFNYEHLAGVGVLTGWDSPYWGSLDAFDTSKIDVLGLTVYPFFSYKTADSVPLVYLDSIFTRIGSKAIAITETGWPADSFIGSWTSSPIQQVDCVNKIFDIIEGHNVEVVNWLFLNYLMDTTDADADKIFRSVAMRDSLGNDRVALPVWLSYCDTTAINEIINNNFLKVNVCPNPFHRTVLIRYEIPELMHITLTLYDATGSFVKLLVDENKKPGCYTISCEMGLAAGIFFLRMEAGRFRSVQKLIEVR